LANHKVNAVNGLAFLQQKFHSCALFRFSFYFNEKQTTPRNTKQNAACK